MKCSVCGKTFTGLTPAGNAPGHSEQGKTCPGSYEPVVRGE
jgi:hypothetical protein